MCARSSNFQRSQPSVEYRNIPKYLAFLASLVKFMQTKRFLKISKIALCVSTTVFVFHNTGFAQNALAPNNSFVIRNARVFDGKQIISSGDVWVEDGKIKEVGQQLQVPSNITTVDGTGDTLLPGLIDAHTHVRGRDSLKEALIFGVTTELDMFTDINYVQQVKKEEAEGKDLELADIRSAGTLATAAGGHGTEYGFSIPTISSPDEAPSWVHAGSWKDRITSKLFTMTGILTDFTGGC